MKTELAKLEEEASKLHGRIISEPYLPTRREMMAQRAKIIERIQDLRLKRHEEEQVEYDKKLQALISQNRPLIFFSVNNKKLEIKENGTVEFAFYPCGHKKKIKVSDLLNFKNDSRLTYDQWIMLFRDNVTMTGKMNCSQCIKDKQSLRAKLSRWNDRPIGFAVWTLRKLQ